MGLYAAIMPAIIGSLFRSSRHVVTGPTNALSLLVGGALVASSHDPTTVAVTLALLVGIMQAGAGLLRLGAVVEVNEFDQRSPKVRVMYHTKFRTFIKTELIDLAKPS